MGIFQFLSRAKESYLMATLIIVESEPAPEDDLVERLMDLPVTNGNTRPHRYYTDNNTKYQIHQSSDTRNLTDIHLGIRALLLFPHYFGFSPELAQVRLRDFTLGAMAGWMVKLWKNSHAPASPVLKCRNCGEQYNMLNDAMVVTMNDVIGEFRKYGGTVLGACRGWPSLVSHGKSDCRRTLVRITKAVNTGSRERWTCAKCSFDQGYPGSFIRWRF
jgi:hypothetical protein